MRDQTFESLTTRAGACYSFDRDEHHRGACDVACVPDQVCQEDRRIRSEPR